MKTDKFGQMIYTQDAVFDILMHDVNPYKPNFKPGPFQIENGQTIDVDCVNKVAGYEALVEYHEDDLSIEEFDKQNQERWYMPDSYKEMDIAAHVLSLCKTEPELQRCGEELLLYMERDLFDLLRYMTYLVDTMELNNVVWGVGRGSSVSSYVLFKLRVHRIDSMFYKLDPSEFLR
jgi:DNA polymerase III alpha subunit